MAESLRKRSRKHGSRSSSGATGKPGGSSAVSVAPRDRRTTTAFEPAGGVFGDGLVATISVCQRSSGTGWTDSAIACSEASLGLPSSSTDSSTPFSIHRSPRP